MSKDNAFAVESWEELFAMEIITMEELLEIANSATVIVTKKLPGMLIKFFKDAMGNIVQVIETASQIIRLRLSKSD